MKGYFTMRSKLFLAFTLLSMLLLSACASGDLAAQTVQDYYQAIVAGDADRALALSCANWELNAQLEVDSFQAVDASLDGFTCEEVSSDGNMAIVTCQGQIVMSYDGEDQYLDLSRQNFQVENAGGDWLFCGYSQ
jgi:ketosteroid isomerase-like protein